MKRREFCLATATLLALPLAGCASDPAPADIAEAIRDGDFEDALTAAHALQAQGRDTPELRLVIGAMKFGLNRFDEARRWFASAEGAGTYLISDPTMDGDDALIRTEIAQGDWLRLTALRSGESIANLQAVDPVERVLSNAWDPARYIREKAAWSRRMFDASILSVTTSAGRDRTLDDLASGEAPIFRCTGYFLAGEMALARNERNLARKHLTTATGQELPLLEFYLAQAELARLSA
ncbi:MAG TPA: hypothetical protein VGF43_07455 [Dongiaceae bacterium]